MNHLRSAWYVVTVVAVTFICSLMVVTGALFGVKYRKGGIYDLAARRWGSWLAALNGIGMRAEGLERVDPSRSYVYIANHVSFADMWVLCALLPDSMRFVAKKELFEI